MTEISKIDYKLGQDNIQFLGLDIHNPVFFVSSFTIIAFVAGVLRAWLMPTFDWVLMGTGNLFVLFCLLLLVVPLGRVRLGGVDARPDYSRSAWFAMLFAAGTGIGLMFFGVAEPVEHFLHPPLGFEAADTTGAARLGMASAIYHWGIHAWAMYVVMAVAIRSLGAREPGRVRPAHAPSQPHVRDPGRGHREAPAYEEIGVDHFTYYASLGLGMKEQKRSMELFVKEVIPAFACRNATQGMPEREDNTRYSARPR